METTNGWKKSLMIFFFAIGFSVFLSAQAFGKVTNITVHQLFKSLENPRVLVLDVRSSGSWQASDKKIKGAVRKNPDTFDSWANELPKDKHLALY